MYRRIVLSIKNFQIFIIPFIIFSYFILNGIALPYVGPNATNFSVYSLIAHNFNKFGYLETKFAPVISISDTLPKSPEYFLHHPTLLSLVESVLFRVFGESFWVGRLTVIIFAFGSMILIFFIGRALENNKFAYISIFSVAMIPASTLFGRMIGQEPFVLFFCLLTLYAIIKYLKFHKKRFLILSLLSITLGILSDWPAAYFILFFFPLFIKHKAIRIWIFLVLFSGAIVSLLLIYVYLMMSGFSDLRNAAALRSFTGLLDIPMWPIRWLAVSIFRILIYFNPLLVIISCYYLFKLYKKKFSDKDIVIFGLFLFGIFHIIFYAQASFTHPYLIYYLLPFVVFSSSSIILKLYKKNRYFIIISIFLFSFLYLITIQDYKNKQIESNLWRFELAREVSHYLTPYEYILNNRDTAIDAVLLWYPFSINMKGTKDEIEPALKKHKHYIFSCPERCNPKDVELNMLEKRYDFTHIVHPKAEAYIFFLQQKKEKLNNKAKAEIQMMSKFNDESKDDRIYAFIRNAYRFAQKSLHVPQF